MTLRRRPISNARRVVPAIERVVTRLRSLHPSPVTWGRAARDGYVRVTLARVRWAERPLPDAALLADAIADGGRLRR